MLRLARDAEFDDIYRLMELSFPIDELRPRDGQLETLRRDCVSAYVSGDGVIDAFFTVWKLDGFSYIEHFAVSPQKRGAGLGGSLLSELLNIIPLPVCLEVEPPERDIAARRIEFYKRAGFFYDGRVWIQFPLSPGQGFVPLRLMTYPSPPSPELYAHMRAEVERRVFGYTPCCTTPQIFTKSS